MNLEADLLAHGYVALRQLPNGRWIGCHRMIWTWGLFIGVDEFGYQERYCYERMEHAVAAALTWNGEGRPPGPWIKRRGVNVAEELGPGAVAS